MRRTLLILFFSAMTYAAWAASGFISIAGTDCPVDTMEHYQVGPGSWYTQMDVRLATSRVVKLYMLDIDLSNPNVLLEARNGGGSVGQNELMLAAAAAIDSAEHRTIGGVNCNFYWTSASSDIGLAGLPTGGTAHNGLLMTEPDGWTMGAENNGNERWRDMGYVAIDHSGHVWMEQMLWDGKITLSDLSSYPLRDCNRYRTDVSDNEIALFNYGLGTHPTRSINSGREIVFSAPQWNINGDITCTILSVNTTGGTLLQKGQGCLQARGSGDTFVSGLSVGDTFILNLGIYAPHIANARPNIKEMVMGNALCMVDGQLITRNTNETYNTTVYARTGIATNNEGNRLWMLVMQTGGMSTTEMCHVFLASGATYAAGMDGGGSAQMELLGEIKNRTTEGTPRAVNTMLFALSTAPDDNEVARIDYIDPLPTTISSYAEYAPSFRAYNQYGWLLSNDFTDYQLSCQPTSLGTISQDGKTFIGSAQGGTGTLTASYGSISVEKTITIEPGVISLRLDSLLIDNREYAIEAFSETNGNKLSINPSVIDWVSSNEQICSVSNGIIKGLINGETDIVGTLGEQTLMLHVGVEIPEAETLLMSDFSNAAEIWEPSSNYGSIEWVGTPSALSFSVNSARSPQVKIEGDVRLYSLPDSILLTLSSTVDIKQITFSGKTANRETLQKTIKAGTNVYEQGLTYVLYPNDLGGSAEDIASYPIYLNSMLFTLQNVKIGTPYTITPRALTLCYKHWQITATENNSSQTLSIYPNPTQNLLIVEGFKEGEELTICDLQGHILIKTNLTGQSSTINMEVLPTGQYIIQTNTSTIKVLKK